MENEIAVGATGGDILTSFLPIFIIQAMIMIPLFWKLADRLSNSKTMYVLLSLIPVFGYFYSTYLFIRTAVLILDRLDFLTKQKGIN